MAAVRWASTSVARCAGEMGHRYRSSSVPAGRDGVGAGATGAAAAAVSTGRVARALPRRAAVSRCASTSSLVSRPRDRRPDRLWIEACSSISGARRAEDRAGRRRCCREASARAARVQPLQTVRLRDAPLRRAPRAGLVDASDDVSDLHLFALAFRIVSTPLRSRNFDAGFVCFELEQGLVDLDYLPSAFIQRTITPSVTDSPVWGCGPQWPCALLSALLMRSVTSL